MEWENNCLIMNKEDDHMDLPPGFRFHPTDEELISHYLSRKVANKSLSSRAVGEVDLNKCEPWDLPWRANMGETEWYFFCVRDRKYPSGLRTNRATDAGYWKATGKDREIYKGKLLVGMKKTLVFYKGRAPKGQKTNWIMHEYRLEGNLSADNLPNAAKNDLVLCRVFHKNHGCKKTHISRMIRTPIASQTDPTRTSPLPPLIDSSETVTNMGEISHMTCFSNQMEDQINNTSLFSMTNSVSLPQFPLDCGFLTENRKQEVSSDTTGMSTDMSSVMSCNELAATGPSVSDGPIDIDCLWNY